MGHGYSACSSQSLVPGPKESDWLKNHVAHGVSNFQVLKVIGKNRVPKMWIVVICSSQYVSS